MGNSGLMGQLFPKKEAWLDKKIHFHSNLLSPLLRILRQKVKRTILYISALSYNFRNRNVESLKGTYSVFDTVYFTICSFWILSVTLLTTKVELEMSTKKLLIQKSPKNVFCLKWTLFRYRPLPKKNRFYLYVLYELDNSITTFCNRKCTLVLIVYR